MHKFLQHRADINIQPLTLSILKPPHNTIHIQHHNRKHRKRTRDGAVLLPVQRTSRSSRMEREQHTKHITRRHNTIHNRQWSDLVEHKHHNRRTPPPIRRITDILVLRMRKRHTRKQQLLTTKKRPHQPLRTAAHSPRRVPPDGRVIPKEPDNQLHRGPIA